MASSSPEQMGLLPKIKPCSDMAAFRETFCKANHIVILTGAGISAESGVPTYHGPGGLWTKHNPLELATEEAFKRDPSLIWESFHYRRENMRSKKPNMAHIAIAECEKRLREQNRRVTIITQNIDELHSRAGSENVIELHGNIFKTRCTQCRVVEVNRDSPICPALRNRGEPDPMNKGARIPVNKLPRCKSCGGLLRPHVVWFHESPNDKDLYQAADELEKCDLCLVIGTSSVVYPACIFGTQVAKRGVPVAEFNIEETPATENYSFHFHGPCGSLLPEALSRHQKETDI